MTSKILAETNNLCWVIPAAAVIGPPYSPGPILAPFLFAPILAYMGNPLVHWLARHRAHRPPGSSPGLLFFGALLALPASAALLPGPRHPGRHYLNSKLHKS